MARAVWGSWGSARSTIFAGTPQPRQPHAGGAGTGDIIKRLDFRGGN